MAAGGGLCILLWLGLVGFQVATAHRDIRSGIAAIESVRSRADAAAVVDGDLLPDLRRAGERFDSAHRRLSGPLFAPARVLPVAGRQVRSVRAQAGAASKVAGVAEASLTRAQPVLRDPGETTLSRAAAIRRLGEIAGEARDELASIRLGPREGLIDPLARAHNRLAQQLAELQSSLERAGTGGRVIADLLTGPRRYLLLAANNAEMRAGAGMFLSAAELETGPEGIELRDLRVVTDVLVPPGSVPLTGDLAERWGWLEPNVEWRNLMTSARFDIAAPLAAEMWEAAGNRPVDGVIAIDPVVLRALLSATGPILVDGRRVDQNTVEEELLHGQYLRFPDLEERPERRESLGRMARAVLEAFDAGNWSVPRLASGLARAGAGRHLLLWSAAGADQDAWRSLGVDGSLQDDSLAVSILNRGGNKLDWFLRVGVDVRLSAAGDDTLVTVEVAVENTVPEGEPRYVAGPDPHSGVGEGVYVGILTVALPGRAQGGYIEGVDSLAVNGRDGPSQVMGFEFTLPRGGSRTVVAHFVLPGRSGSLEVVPSARVPAVPWNHGGETWSDAGPRALTWGP